MKAKLIKVNDYYYLRESYKTGIGGAVCERTLGTTNSQGELGKLSKQNCDELFGVTDVEKLAKIRFSGSDDITNYNLRFGFQEGFNKAMELMKDKQFTEEDVRQAYIYGVSNGHSFGFPAIDHANKCIQSLQQPSEIEVEIEMKKVVDETKVIGAVKGVKGSGDKITTYKSIPKLDSEGYLILKKI